MGLILLATLLFSIMSCLVRLGSDVFRADSFVFVRCFLQAAFLLPWFVRGMRPVSALRQSLPFHFFRGSIGIVSMWLLYFALSELPLVMVGLLGMTSVFWAGLLGSVFLKEHQGRASIGCALLICAGIGIVLIPDHATAWTFSLTGVVAALLSGMSMGVAQTVIRQMRQNLGTVEIVFWFGVVGALLTSPFFVTHPQWPATLGEGGLLLGTALCATVAQLLLTYGYRFAPAMLGSLCLITGNVWNLGLGMGVLGELPPPHFWGGLILTAVGMVALLLQSRQPNTPREIRASYKGKGA
jgi:S-adenosylmethionine uptake transporter